MDCNNSQKRKRRTVTLTEKYAIIQESKKRKVAELSKEFNHPASTIRSIIKDEKRITEAINSGANGKNRNLRGAQHPDLEGALLLWLKQAKSENVAVNGSLLKKKAAALAKLLNINGFVASNGWLDNFKKRNEIVFKEAQGVAASVDVEAVGGDYSSNILLPLLPEYESETLHNCFEEAGFSFVTESVNIPGNAEEDVVRLWEEFRAQEDVDESINVPDYLNLDKDLLTANTFLEETAKATPSNSQKELDNDEEAKETEETPLPPVTLKAAYHGFNTLRRYLEENRCDSKAMELCNYFEEFLYQERRKKDARTNMD